MQDMEKHPFITVIIPALDEEHVLPHFLEDLSKQTFADFEVIVVDGQSKDNTQLIVKEYAKRDKRFKLAVSPIKNVGAQRNIGGNQARSTYVLFLDADNRIPEYFLEGIHYHLLRSPYDAFTTYCIADTDNVKDKLLVSSINQIMSVSGKMGRQVVVLGACIGCKKEVFDTLEGFDETITYAEDFDFVQRLSKQYDFHIFTNPTFTVSLRRFRKEGTLNMYRKIVPLALKILIEGKVTQENTQYPMKGGSYYLNLNKKEEEQLKRNLPSIQVLRGFLHDIQSLAKTSRHKIKNALKTLLLDEQNF